MSNTYQIALSTIRSCPAFARYIEHLATHTIHGRKRVCERLLLDADYVVDGFDIYCGVRDRFNAGLDSWDKATFCARLRAENGTITLNKQEIVCLLVIFPFAPDVYPVGNVQELIQEEG